MQAMLLGKVHRSGVSKKSGNAYDNTVVYVSYPSRGIEGQVTEEIWLSGRDYPVHALTIGEIYNIDRDNRGRVVGFDRVS